MFLSIITINKNNLSGLQKTLQSVFIQSYKNFELIVIDGASVDGSLDYIRENEKLIKFWSSEPDDGIYAALNKGILQATGDYVFFLNSGDWFCDPHVLEGVFSKEYSADFIACDIYTVCQDGKSKLISYSKFNFDFYFFLRIGICQQALFYKRSCFSDYFFDTRFRLVSDWKFLFQKMVLEKYSMSYCSLPIVFYDKTGITSQPEAKDRIKFEKEEIIRELFSPLVSHELFLGVGLKEKWGMQYFAGRNDKPLYSDIFKTVFDSIAFVFRKIVIFFWKFF